MTVEATMHVARPSRRDAYLDWIQMLSGAALVLFMWAHMILVSSVIIGPGVMNAIANFFEETYMAQVGGPLLFVLFLIHFVIAARKIPFRVEGQKTAWLHAKMLHHKDTWLWMVQAISAMIILVLGAVHIFVVLTDLPITAAKSAARIQSGWWLFYLVLLPLVELHVSIGFYRIAIKWGIIQADRRKWWTKVENILLAIFLTIGFITLIRFMTM